MHARYESRGLTILGVTDEDASKTVPWVQKNRAAYPYAYDPGNRLGKWFGITSIPHAVLVDPHGTVVWKGHPNRLDEKTLALALKDAIAEPITGWPRNTIKLQQFLKHGQYAKALSAAVSLGHPYEGFVRDRVEAKVRSVQEAHERGDYRLAQLLGTHVAKELAGLREATRVKGLVDGMRRDKQIQAVITAQEEVAKCAQSMGTLRSKRAATQLETRLAKVRDEHANTIAGAQAQRCLQELAQRSKGLR